MSSDNNGCRTGRDCPERERFRPWWQSGAACLAGFAWAVMAVCLLALIFSEAVRPSAALAGALAFGFIAVMATAVAASGGKKL